MPGLFARVAETMELFLDLFDVGQMSRRLGHGVERDEDLADIESDLRTIAECKAQKQAFLVDCCVLHAFSQAVAREASWCGGCKCHEVLLRNTRRQHRRISCMWKGRRAS
eukprot:15457728-Alexandrium_andersonii.AAC.1